ncbi:CG0192-related protein [Micromonospora sp. LOL_023]|uniref:CG0192-related protein n=1 Tax=Micromonospora sp. LOL_023 TaxID=3345418 RepID=UPI003A8924A3
MALLHRAELRPTKLELLAAWLPGRDWYQDPGAGELTRVAAYRFDDPAGQVGIETFLVRPGDGPVYQVPLTYRGAPLVGAEQWLIDTVEHSVLGRRWVYDGCGDPVYVAALASAIVADTGQATEFIEVDGELVGRAPSMEITSTGTAGVDVPVIGTIRRVISGDRTVIGTDTVELTVLRRLGTAQLTGDAVLTGAWAGQPDPIPLAHATSTTRILPAASTGQ